jgi:hypothetical protein
MIGRIRARKAGGVGALLFLGCSSSHGETPVGDNADPASTACIAGSALQGAAYDISKSRFAFGGTPTPVDAGSLVRWTGPDGVVAIFSNGAELASLDANVPEQNAADFNGDDDALKAYVSAYYESMGAVGCQIADSAIFGGFGAVGSIDGGTTVVSSWRTANLARGLDGIAVVESIAYARFDVDDQSTSAGFYWPTIPADVVSDARALRDRLADPAGLAAYKALLPANAQGDGQVAIHHTSMASSSPFASAATYDVNAAASVLGAGPLLSFDANAHPVSNDW